MPLDSLGSPTPLRSRHPCSHRQFHAGHSGSHRRNLCLLRSRQQRPTDRSWAADNGWRNIHAHDFVSGCPLSGSRTDAVYTRSYDLSVAATPQSFTDICSIFTH
jgi:hypothetical protein